MYITVGKVNLSSPDHIALLVHQIFNVSIPRHHIPTDHWEFEYGAAVNDPEFGPDAAAAGETTADARESEEGGKWIHSITGEKLGGADGFLEFTVIGYVLPLFLLIYPKFLIGSQLRMKCYRYGGLYNLILSRLNMSPRQWSERLRSQHRRARLLSYEIL